MQSIEGTRLTDDMQAKLNEHLGLEMYSAQVYLALGAEFAHNGLTGIAWWCRLQCYEEWCHAHKLMRYLQACDVMPVVPALQAPPTGFDDALAAFELAYEHEKMVTASVHKLLDDAVEYNDFPTQEFLQWFVREQVEEEAGLRHIIKRLRIVGAGGPGLVQFDRELGRRAYNAREMSPDGFPA
jgi:ferritin